MKVLYKTVDGRFNAEFEGSEKEIFSQVARFEEVFGNLVCSNGKESSDKVIFRVRSDKEGNEYFEQVCVDDSKPELRFARRAFGQHKGKEGTLFPRDGGAWVKWNGTEEVPLVPRKAKKKDEEKANTDDKKDGAPF